jgi:hypothetical protein
MSSARRDCEWWKAHADDGCNTGIVAIGPRTTIRFKSSMKARLASEAQRKYHFTNTLDVQTPCGMMSFPWIE